MLVNPLPSSLQTSFVHATKGYVQKAKLCFSLSLFPAGLCDHADRVDEWHDVGVDVPVVEREVVPAEEVDRRQAVDQHAERE